MEMEALLVERKLFGAGLVRLTSHMVERYNRCLVSAGLAPTELQEIDIDAIGVSPQIVQERNDPYYLCNGLANPLAIIVSPDQYNMPVYYPIFSWMRRLMRTIFDKGDNHKRIIDITATDGIVFDLEDGLSAFNGAGDLLLLTEITAVPHLEKLAGAAEAQAELIATFSEGLNCLRDDICDELVASREASGDLRKRKLILSPLAFNSFADFHTVAFGGASVLRDVDGVDLLVLEDKEMFDAAMKNKRKLGSAQVHYLFDEEMLLFEKLRKNHMIVVPVNTYRDDPQLLEFKKELLLADALCDCEEKINWRTLSPAARKALLSKHKDRVPPEYFELERFAAGLKAGRVLQVSQELYYLLVTPQSKLPPATQEILWILLTRKEPRNLLDLYTADKNAFLARYATWSPTKRLWAADYLAARYKHQHTSSQTERVSR